MVASPDFTLLCLHVETFRVSDSPEVSLTQVDFSKVLSDAGIPGLRAIGPRFWGDLTDVTLADEDTNPILTDNAHRTFQGNLATRVTQPGGQIWNQAMQVT